MDSTSFVDDMIDRSFKNFAHSLPKISQISKTAQNEKNSPIRERFLRELAGIDPMEVKADLGKEIEVVQNGRCFYVETDKLWSL